LGTILSLLAPSAAWAQLPPVGVPPGVVRFEVDGDFGIWDDRFLDGEREPLGTVLGGSALGSALLPGLAADESSVRRITGLADYQTSLGRLTADVLAERNTAMFGLSLGLTRAITIFGRMPLVRARVQPALGLDTEGANTGFAPTLDQQATFFGQFDNALTTLAANIAAGAYDGDPAQRALADATLAAGGTLNDDLFTLLTDPEGTSPFVPTATSEAGAAITGRVAALQATLSGSLGIPGFTTAPVLPTDPATEAGVLGFVSDSFGPIGLRAGESIVSFRGDAEAGASVTLTDKWDRDGRRGGLRAAVEALVRFPTGSVARTDRLLALGTGDGQTDVEVRGTVDVGSGNWGARLEGGYNRQLAADIARRVAPPGQPFPGVDLLTNVRRDPGDVVTLAVRPFYRLARTFALIGALEYQKRGEDEVTYATDADVIPGVDAAVLAEGTDASAALLSVGFTYANPGGLRPGGRGLPVDAGLNYERVLRASGGVVPDVHRVRATFRVYIGVF
jgi:hypothetical protein